MPLRICLALLVLLVAESSHAVPDKEAEVRARAHLKAGDRLFEQQQFKSALNEFLDGYAALPKPGFLFNIAECYRNMADAEKAAENYEAYLNASPSGSRAKEARKNLELLRAERERIVTARAEAVEKARLESEAAASAALEAQQKREADEERNRLAATAKAAAHEHQRAEAQETQRIAQEAEQARVSAALRAERVRREDEKRRRSRNLGIAVGVSVGLVVVVGVGVGAGIALTPTNASVPQSTLGTAPILRFQ